MSLLAPDGNKLPDLAGVKPGKLDVNAPKSTVDKLFDIGDLSYHTNSKFVDDLDFADASKMQKKFDKHKDAFGMNDLNWNKENGKKFLEAMKAHIKNPETVRIEGTHRNTDPVSHFYNKNTNINVMVDKNTGKIISGWYLDDKQLDMLKLKRNVQ